MELWAFFTSRNKKHSRTCQHPLLTKKRTLRLQASGFLDLVSQKLGVKWPRSLTTQTKNPRLQAPRFLCFSRWNMKLNTLHTCSNFLLKNPRLGTLCFLHFSRGKAHLAFLHTYCNLFLKNIEAPSPKFSSPFKVEGEAKRLTHLQQY